MLYVPAGSYEITWLTPLNDWVDGVDTL